jgi:hypothetical protein
MHNVQVINFLWRNAAEDLAWFDECLTHGVEFGTVELEPSVAPAEESARRRKFCPLL